MRKVFLSLAISFVAVVSAFAQHASYTGSSFFSTAKAEQPIALGIRAGINVASASIEGFDMSNRVGYNFGVSADFAFIESLGLESGIYFTQKGSKYLNNKYNAHYLEIPILASYRYNIGSNAQVRLNFGPYIAFGLGGKYYEGNESYKLFDEDEADFKRFDAGLQIGTGVTIKKLYVGLGYNFGLANVAGDSSTRSIKNKNLFVQLGYNF